MYTNVPNVVTGRAIVAIVAPIPSDISTFKIKDLPIVNPIVPPNEAPNPLEYLTIDQLNFKPK